MSEQAKETNQEPNGKKGEKKKGKLPIILVLLLVIGGGGFFAMKSKGGPKKVEIKVGAVEPLDKEFLVNLAGGANTYLRTEIAFELRDGFKKEDLDAQMPAIRNCINQILRSKTLQEVGATQETLEGSGAFAGWQNRCRHGCLPRQICRVGPVREDRGSRRIRVTGPAIRRCDEDHHELH